MPLQTLGKDVSALCIGALIFAAAYGPPVTATETLSARQAAFVALQERGVSEATEVFALHGTSLAAIEIALQTGFLPPSLYRRGALFVQPTRRGAAQAERTLPRERRGHLLFPTSEYPPFGDARQMVEAYAQSLGVASAVLRAAGIPYSEGAVHYFDADLNGFDSEAAYFQNYGLNRAAFEEAKRNARSQRRGVLLGISLEALGEYALGPGDDPQDVTLVVDRGLSWRFIAGIAALGSDERAFFVELAGRARSGNDTCGDAVVLP